MLLRVKCGGVVIGTAEFDPPEGLAHAPLLPTSGYALAVSPAQALGRTFAKTQYWLATNRDFADAAAAAWEGGRLALEDVLGRELAVNNIVVIDSPAMASGQATIRVIADFRPDLARVAARELTTGPPPGSRNRPAA